MFRELKKLEIPHISFWKLPANFWNMQTKVAHELLSFSIKKKQTFKACFQ